MPGTVPGQFATHPVEVTSVPAIGAAPTFVVNSAVEIIFLVVGQLVPAVGDILIGHRHGSQWIAWKAGFCPARTVCVNVIQCGTGPAIGTTVSWTGPGGFTATCVTNGLGQCCVAPAGSGTYTASAVDILGNTRSVSIVVGSACHPYLGFLCLGGAWIQTVVHHCDGGPAIGNTVTITGAASASCVTASVVGFPPGSCHVCVPTVPGTYTVTSGSASATVSLTTPCGIPTQVFLCLDGWGTIKGQLLDLCYNPIVGATVSFQGGSATTDVLGNWSICYPTAPTTHCAFLGGFTGTLTATTSNARILNGSWDICNDLNKSVSQCTTTDVGIIFLETASGYTLCGSNDPATAAIDPPSGCLCAEQCGPIEDTIDLVSTTFGAFTMAFDAGSCSWGGTLAFTRSYWLSLYSMHGQYNHDLCQPGLLRESRHEFPLDRHV